MISRQKTVWNEAILGTALSYTDSYGEPKIGLVVSIDESETEIEMVVWDGDSGYKTDYLDIENIKKYEVVSLIVSTVEVE